jgi:tetratricopeptide (TPR) repeat protein
MSNRQVKQMLAQQQSILDELAKRRGKDNWDKLATLSTFLSSIVIGVIGIYFANAYKAKEIAHKGQELRIAETQIVEKFVPLLAGTDENAKKGALLTIASLDNKELAIRLGSSYASAGTIEAMEILLKETEGENKALLRDSLVDALYNRTLNNSSSNDRIISDVNQIFSLKSEEELKAKYDGYFLADCYLRRASGYAGLAKYDLALKDIQESFRIVPNYGNAYWDLARLYQWRNDAEQSLEQALRFFDLAVQNKASTGVMLERGQLHAKLNNIEQAIADFAEHITYRPNDPAGYFQSALAREKKGDWAGAYHDLKRGRGFATEQYPPAQFDSEIEEASRHIGVRRSDGGTAPPRPAPPAAPQPSPSREPPKPKAANAGIPRGARRQREEEKRRQPRPAGTRPKRARR